MKKVKKQALPVKKPLMRRLRKKLRRIRRSLTLTSLVAMLSLTSACQGLPTKQVDPANQIVPQYSSAQFRAVISDEKTCGPEAKQFLYDYTAILTGAQ